MSVRFWFAALTGAVFSGVALRLGAPVLSVVLGGGGALLWCVFLEWRSQWRKG